MPLATLTLLSMLSGAPALPARYLALGDSYTIGESVAAAERWPNQLVAMLREQGANLGNAPVSAKTNRRGKAVLRFRGPACVGAVALLVESVSRSGADFDRSVGRLTNYVIPLP